MSEPLKLHLGCGDIHLDGFVNIDARPTHATDKTSDIADLRDYQDNSVSSIYASHCLEHFSYKTVKEVLKEWHRVLKPGSSIYIAVPDFDILVNAYTRHFTWNIFKARIHSRILNDAFLGDFLGGQDYPENTHRCLFNQKSLTALLQETGFHNIKRIKPPTWAKRGAALHYASMMIRAEKK
jgi:predicted SAM-dependent methyltransferase